MIRVSQEPAQRRKACAQDQNQAAELAAGHIAKGPIARFGMQCLDTTLRGKQID